jgi:hypothetical protein
MEVGPKSYESGTDIERKLDSRRTKVKQKSSRTTKQHNNITMEQQNEMKRCNRTDCAGRDTAERSGSTSFVVMACKREERNFFLFLHVFFFFFTLVIIFLLIELLQGLLTTGLQA